METVLLEVMDSVYTVADDKQATVLIGLDRSAAFDTGNHITLLQNCSLWETVTIVKKSDFLWGCSVD